MAYIGKQPLVGNYTVLDSLTATTTDTYALTKNSVAVFPQTPANCIVSLNGVIQAPFDSYTISGSNIVFASALTASDSIDFITVLGDVLNVGTVSDNTITTAKIQDSAITTAKLNDASVSLAKLTATGTKDATTFLRGDNTFATPTDNGKVLQVVYNSPDVGAVSNTGTAWTETTTDLRTSITPTNSSSLLLLNLTFLFGGNFTGKLSHFRFYDVTNASYPSLGTNGGTNRTPVHGSARQVHTDSNDVDMVTLTAAFTAGSTSARTYTLHNINENGDSITKYFFATFSDVTAVGYAKPVFTIMEIEI